MQGRPQGRPARAYLPFLAVLVGCIFAEMSSIIFRWSWRVGRVVEAKLLTSAACALVDVFLNSATSFLWSWTNMLTYFLSNAARDNLERLSTSFCLLSGSAEGTFTAF